MSVGDLLRLHSRVLHTAQLPAEQSGLVAVEVEALVASPERCQADVTNTFRTFFKVCAAVKRHHTYCS